LKPRIADRTLPSGDFGPVDFSQGFQRRISSAHIFSQRKCSNQVDRTSDGESNQLFVNLLGQHNFSIESMRHTGKQRDNASGFGCRYGYADRYIISNGYSGPNNHVHVQRHLLTKRLGRGS
jgi:hypothetical protein